jgi:hypothetical protein
MSEERKLTTRQGHPVFDNQDGEDAELVPGD